MLLVQLLPTSLCPFFFKAGRNRGYYGKAHLTAYPTYLLP